MATLISPGVSVTVIDESFYIPAVAPTIPLFFVATEADKLKPDASGIAPGTQESGVIRTITSAAQLADTYGVPVFRKTGAVERDGLFTNEYGLFAINTFLGVGNFCYVVRADVDLAAVPETQVGLNQVKAALSAEIVSNTSGIKSEWYEYNLILCPFFGYMNFDTPIPGTEGAIATNLIALSNELNNEAFVIFDGPHQMTPEDFAQEALSFPKSPYAAVWYPGGKGTNLDGASVWVPASAIGIRVIALSDNVSEVWFVPAGFRRGIVDNVSSVGYVGNVSASTGEGDFTQADLSVGQRDVLYADGKNVNPITRFPGRGIAVFGQKTQSSNTSALDRINVARLLVAMRRSIRKGAMSYVFEPNDQITRDNLRVSIEGFLGDIMTRRGLYDFAVVSDESNNTPTRIDRNELWVDIAIKPVKAAEFIYIPIRVLSTGAQL